MNIGIDIKEIKWLFFDIGTTLIDETEAYSHRIRDAIEGTDITFEEFNEKRIEFAKQNLKGDLEEIKFFGLDKTVCHKEDEKPYPDAERVLKYLVKKKYKIGIIANQSAGTKERLENWGLLQYIDVVMASAEEKVAKPDKEIFLRALKRAGCAARNAVMIGDRLDNDIFPAKKVGMKTIWVKQGMAAYGSPKKEAETPDHTIDKISELMRIF